MIVFPAMTMRMLMQQIVEAAHSLSDETGAAHRLSTIPPDALRMAAITALQIATGEPIWPGDKKIQFARPRVSYGIFEERE